MTNWYPLYHSRLLGQKCYDCLDKGSLNCRRDHNILKIQGSVNIQIWAWIFHPSPIFVGNLVIPCIHQKPPSPMSFLDIDLSIFSFLCYVDRITLWLLDVVTPEQNWSSLVGHCGKFALPLTIVCVFCSGSLCFPEGINLAPFGHNEIHWTKGKISMGRKMCIFANYVGGDGGGSGMICVELVAACSHHCV